jgi:hypothetical protein
MSKTTVIDFLLVTVVSILGASLVCTLLRPADHFFYVFYALTTSGLIVMALLAFLGYFKNKMKQLKDFSSPLERFAVLYAGLTLSMSVFYVLIGSFILPSITAYAGSWYCAAISLHSILMVPGLRLMGIGICCMRECFGYLPCREPGKPMTWGVASSFFISGICLCLLNIGLAIAASSLSMKVAIFLARPI